VESSLRHAIVGHAAIVNVSGGQTIVHLTGKHALDVLMKSTCYDVHELNFHTGKVITSTLAQAQVIIRRLDSDQFELVIRRSFADYIWMWLRDAAAEFGVNG
jgi:sarcosine oxidase subunit gamma